MRRAHRGRLAAVVSALCLIALFAGSLLLPARSVLADPPAPRKKDTSPRIKSKNAALTVSIDPAEAGPGDMVTLKVAAKLDPGYHIYKLVTKDNPPGSGPVYTTFDLFETDGLEPQGDWSASRDPIRHKEENFPDLDFVEYYEDEVTWNIKLKVPPGTAPGKKTVRVQAGYMICNDRTCSPPGRWTLPAATLTVSAAGRAGKAPAAVAAKPASPVAEKAASVDTAKVPSAPAEAAAKAAPAAAVTSASTPSSSSPSSPAPKSGAFSSSSAAASTAPAASAAASSSGSSSKAKSEIAQKAEQGLIPFLIASAIGGLFALVMPCVWPMVPITVNFFVKQGQGPGGRGKATGLAITYCLSIIGVFTAVGVLFSFFFSASALQTLANNPWLNFFVATLFVVFGLSLLGLFEIRLPSFLLNASSRGESRGGVVGVVFMALTLTITSFTCTFPVVGGLLVMAAQGNFFYPIIGLATFATVIALPFFLLALSPGLIQKMPRGGDWMNAVKVVGGLIEIGAALKFVNTAELAFVTPENAWFNAPVVLTCWIALSIVCGLYLLGLFRTDHDHDEVKVGPGRLVFGAGFLGLALFLLPALFGHAPKSQFWNRLVVGLLPPDTDAFNPPVQVVGAGGESSGPVKAMSSDPVQAEREQKSFHGVQWGWSLEQAKEQAAREKRPILVDFTGVNCPNCRQMERSVFPLPSVVPLLRRFVTVQLYTDYEPIDSITPEQREERAAINQDRRLEFGEATNPFYVVLSPSGEVVSTIGGYNEPPVFIDFLNKALEKASEAGGEKVAQAGSGAEAPRGPSDGGR